jgi:hypothetical protein
VTESTSAVEQAVQQRIQAAKVKVAAARERRASLAEARRAGLARRHARKLAALAKEERAQQQRLDADVGSIEPRSQDAEPEETT